MTRRDGGSLLVRRPGSFLDRPFSFGSSGADPWTEMAMMRREMEDLFSRFFGSSGLQSPAPTTWGQPTAEPDVDVYDNENEYMVYAALPGCKPDDIKLQATNDTITLSCEYHSPIEGQTGAATEQQGPTPLKQSRYSSAGRYEFSYSFPDDVDPNKVTAELKNGRLEVRIPKVQVEGRGKPISIPIQGMGTQPALQEGKQPALPAESTQKTRRAAQETKPKPEKGPASQTPPPMATPF